MKITGIITCGSYPSWIDYAIGSIYNAVDEIIVINSGYDISKIELGCGFPELTNSKKIKEILNIEKKLGLNKIHLIEGVDYNKLNSIFKINYNVNEYARSGNVTYASKLATKRGADWTLAVAADQILYMSLSRQSLDYLIKLNHSGYRLWQYADFIFNLQHHRQLPDDGTNDGSLFYKSQNKSIWYGGQGAISGTVEQYKINFIHAAHMRYIVPFNTSPYEYYYKRQFYHLYAPNEIMELDYNKNTGLKYSLDEIKQFSHNDAIHKINQTKILENNTKNNIPTNGIYKLNEINDIRAPKDIPKILKIGIERYITPC